MNEFYMKDVNGKRIKFIELDRPVQDLKEHNSRHSLKFQKVLDRTIGLGGD